MILSNEADTHAIGQALATVLRRGDVIALFGDLGAGKTTLARGILSGLGLADEAPSPSYPLVIPYEPPLVTLPVWHVDLFRLDAPEQAEELGLDEALFDGALIIEWPDRLGTALWPEALRFTLEPEANGGRRLTAQVPPSWEGRCPIK